MVEIFYRILLKYLLDFLGYESNNSYKQSPEIFTWNLNFPNEFFFVLYSRWSLMLRVAELLCHSVQSRFFGAIPT